MLYSPDPILITIGPITIYWYGLTMALALLAGLLVSVKVASWYGIAKEVTIDLFFYLVIFGFIGARLFYVLYNLPYFIDNPLDAVKMWEGGIGIHGGIIAGAAVVWWFAKTRMASVSSSKFRDAQQAELSGIPSKTSVRQSGDPRLRGDDTVHKFFLLSAIITPGLALGQAIGRWGNFFNQELFGLPTNLPWGIPIDVAHRPEAFAGFTYFHPTFLYESIGNLLIFAALLALHMRIRDQESGARLTTFMYIFLYSVLRFAMETLRLDPVGMLGGLRVTMWLAVAGAVVGIGGLWRAQR